MKNELGNQYGRLTVVSKAKSKVTNGGKSRLAMWLCICECGTTVTVSGHDLRRGNTSSCGCFRREQLAKANTVHGDSKRNQPNARLYRIWANMNTRCRNKNFSEFEHYGGKGIRVEFEDYSAFKRWAYQNGYHEQPEGTPAKDMLSIDRIDSNGNYSPENCRFISLSENSKRRNQEYWSEKCRATRAEVRKDTRNDYEVEQSSHETPRVKEL